MAWSLQGLMAWTLAFLLVLAAGCRSDTPGSSAAADAIVAEPATTSTLAAVEGTVVLADSDDAAGIQVFIPGTRHFVVTESDGTFLLDDLEAGTYRLLARAAGYRSAVLHEALTVGVADLGGVLHLEPVTLEVAAPRSAPADPGASLGAIRGTVRVAGDGGESASGLGVSASVELDGTPYRTTTLADGSFLLWNLPPDEYRMTVTAPGMEPASLNVRVVPGDEVVQTVELLPQVERRDGVIRGRVELYDAQGQPSTAYDGVTVRLLDGGQTARVGPDGTFTLTGLARTRHIVVAGGAMFGQSTPVEADLSRETVTNIQFVLAATQPLQEETGSVSGFVIKEDRAADDHRGIIVALAGSQAVAATDELGYYRMEKVTPGSYRLIASAPGYRTVEVGPIEVVAGEPTEVEGIYLELDREAPELVATEPADGARDVVVQRLLPVSLRFSRPMNLASLASAIRISPPVAFEIDSDPRLPQQIELTLFGSGAEPVLQFGTRYTVTIDASATDHEGVPMDGAAAFSFTTGRAAVITTQPADDGRLQRLGPDNPVIIYFNAAIDPASIRDDAIRIRPALAAAPVVYPLTDPESGWTRLQVQGIWQPNTEYAITVQRRLRTVDGQPLMNTPYTFRFRTAQQVPADGRMPGTIPPGP